jgi:hypothetical protein
MIGAHPGDEPEGGKCGITQSLPLQLEAQPKNIVDERIVHRAGNKGLQRLVESSLRLQSKSLP